MNKQKATKDFFEELESVCPVKIRKIVFERIDANTLKEIDNYGEKIEASFKKTGINCNISAIVANSVIFGYLLKGQMDRAELEELFLQKD